MNVVKGLALSLLGFLLFLSLSAFGVMFMLNSTVLNPDFMVRELDRLDVHSLAREWLDEQIPQFEVPVPYEPYVAKIMDDTVDDTLADLEPWIGREVNAVIYASYDYLMGRSPGLDRVISLEPVRDSLKQNLKETALASLPPELQGLPPDVIQAFLDEANRQIDDQIPQSVELDLRTLDPEVVTALEQARQYIGYFQLIYKFMIGFILLLILGIILIYREVRGSTRSLGITFLTCGVITYLGNLATKYFAGVGMTQLELPIQFRTWLPQLMADLLAPLDIYGIVLAAIGIALLIVFFVYKPRQPSF